MSFPWSGECANPPGFAATALLPSGSTARLRALTWIGLICRANQGQERLGGKRMVHCAADSTSAKSILYGGNEPAPHATQGGKKMLDAHRGVPPPPALAKTVVLNA